MFLKGIFSDGEPTEWSSDWCKVDEKHTFSSVLLQELEDRAYMYSGGDQFITNNLLNVEREDRELNFRLEGDFLLDYKQNSYSQCQFSCWVPIRHVNCICKVLLL